MIVTFYWILKHKILWSHFFIFLFLLWFYDLLIHKGPIFFLDQSALVEVSRLEALSFSKITNN